jgi:hypothetical protein
MPLEHILRRQSTSSLILKACNVSNACANSPIRVCRSPRGAKLSQKAKSYRLIRFHPTIDRQLGIPF